MSQKPHSMPDMAYAPPLMQITRGEIEGQRICECVHHGIIAVVDGQGNLLANVGEAQTLIPLRSMAKPFQLLTFLKYGLFEKTWGAYGHRLLLSDLALMMSSHGGENFQVERLRELLTILGLSRQILKCGIQPPSDESSKIYLVMNGKPIEALHHNCSGKHLAMLATCHERGLSIDTYWQKNHPLQEEIGELIQNLSQTRKELFGVGIDGCSLPTFIMPIYHLALLYGRLAHWQKEAPKNQPSWLPFAAQSIWQAFVQYPKHTSGSERFESVLMHSLPGQIIAKTGADGGIAVGVAPCERFPFGLGIAIKIADGDPKMLARPFVLLHVLKALHILPKELPLWPRALIPFGHQEITNLNGYRTGHMDALFGMQLD